MASEFTETNCKHQETKKEQKQINSHGSKIVNRSEKDSCVTLDLLVVVVTAKTLKKISAGQRYGCY